LSNLILADWASPSISALPFWYKSILAFDELIKAFNSASLVSSIVELSALTLISASALSVD
jgi:hypothetical protein